MNRIEGIEPKELGFFAGLFVRFFFWVVRRKLGKVTTPMRVTARNPRILFGIGMMEQSLAAGNWVPMGLKDLAQLRTGTLIGCPF
jgi:hypothetical protein